MTRRALVLAIAGAAAALCAGGCGGGSPGAAAPIAGSALGLSAPIAVYTCTEWRDAGVRERQAAVGRIRDFTGGQVTGRGAAGRGTVLEDESAYDFFEQACEQPYAQHFLLYKLYGHAAGFAGVAPEN